MPDDKLSPEDIEAWLKKRRDEAMADFARPTSPDMTPEEEALSDEVSDEMAAEDAARHAL